MLPETFLESGDGSKQGIEAIIDDAYTVLERNRFYHIRGMTKAQKKSFLYQTKEALCCSILLKSIMH